jgi:hypothetical protein
MARLSSRFDISFSKERKGASGPARCCRRSRPAEKIGVIDEAVGVAGEAAIVVGVTLPQLLPVALPTHPIDDEPTDTLEHLQVDGTVGLGVARRLQQRVVDQIGDDLEDRRVLRVELHDRFGRLHRKGAAKDRAVGEGPLLGVGEGGPGGLDGPLKGASPAGSVPRLVEQFESLLESVEHLGRSTRPGLAHVSRWVPPLPQLVVPGVHAGGPTWLTVRVNSPSTGFSRRLMSAMM